MAGPSKNPDDYTREHLGRPSKFTPERRAAIIDDIRNRVPYEIAAEANGICEDTLYEWLKTAREHKKNNIDSEYTLFSESIKAAERFRIIEHNDNIANHVDKWQGDAWILERRWHKHYGSNAQLNELSQKVDRLLDGEVKHGQEKEESSEEG